MQKLDEIAIDDIRVSSDMLREMDSQVVSELMKSIQANGLLQPILVRPIASSYEVVFGHHRLEACRGLGWKTIPAVAREMSDDDSFITKVVENLQRNVTIDPLREAHGYITLINHGWTVDTIARRIGKSDSYVSDRIGLIRRLHPDIANKMKHGNSQLKPSHCELLARVRSRSYQLELSGLIETKHLSVRRLERMISGGQPFKERVEGEGGSLYLKLPEEIAKCMKIQAGDRVYIYLQSRKRIAIEHATVQDVRPNPGRAIAGLSKKYVTVPAK